MALANETMSPEVSSQRLGTLIFYLGEGVLTWQRESEPSPCKPLQSGQHGKSSFA